jgi:hypothetical protein
MEQGGPHLPSAGEPLDSRADERPTWWQACGRAGPFGSRYLWWWKEHPGLTLFLYHGLGLLGIGLFTLIAVVSKGSWISLLALMFTWIVLSMNWGQGTGMWLLAHTARLYEWPPAVKQAVGAALRRGAGW